MLLALDAGNSNITIGAFEGRKLVCQWRLRTVHEQTADEWGILLHNLFGPAGLDIDSVDGMIISSVVPPIDSTLAFMAERYFHTQAMFVGPGSDLGLTILYDNPNEVGADRLVNGVAGFRKYGGPCVIVDLGTTINFDVISRNGEYLGGAIAVGIGIAIDALFAKTARLPLVDFRPPQGRNRLQHRGQHAVRTVLRRRRHDRRHPGAHHRENGPGYQDRGHGRPGAFDRFRVALSLQGGRAPHPGRPANDLGAEPLPVNEQDNDRASSPEPASEASQGWVSNYFNYFTEIEEHFQRARGTGLFLLSPLDWALIDTWKNAGVPLEAVMRGIDSAFEKWRGRKVKTRMVNSLAFCAQAVLTEAQIMAGAGAGRAPARETAPPFSLEELHRYLRASAAALPAGYEEIAAALERLAAEVNQYYADLEALEQRLTVLEEKTIAIARTRQSEERMLEARRELDRQLRPYRGKMTADQLALLEKRYLERDLLEEAGLPRLSLFYMR